MYAIKIKFPFKKEGLSGFESEISSHHKSNEMFIEGILHM